MKKPSIIFKPHWLLAVLMMGTGAPLAIAAAAATPPIQAASPDSCPSGSSHTQPGCGNYNGACVKKSCYQCVQCPVATPAIGSQCPNLPSGWHFATGQCQGW